MPPEPSEAGGLDDLDRVVASLNKHRVEFLVIGGYAVVYHGHVRNTQDLDLFVRPTAENARRTVAALSETGFASPNLTPDVFVSDNGIQRPNLVV